MSILNYQNLTLTYNEQEILHHIDLMIPKNQITVIVGQSGSGKSTLLKATMGLLSDDAKIIEGKILFEIISQATKSMKDDISESIRNSNDYKE